MSQPYTSMSFGKDSTVMVHLLIKCCGLDIPVFYVDCGKWDEWPDTPRVKQEFLEIVSCDFTELSGPSIMSAYLQSGFYIQDEEGFAEGRKAQRDYGKSLESILDTEAKRRGLNGAFIGIRKEESNNRRRLFVMRGELYFAKTRQMWACHPLMNWSSKDIWAYIVKYDLPYNELYDLDPRGRELARNGAMFGSRSARYGRMAFMRQMYPDLWNEFLTHLPEAGRWSG
jgi:phosphoadenosine phosphosulfate reductase